MCRGWGEVVEVSWQLYLSLVGVPGCALFHTPTFSSFITHAHARNINQMKAKLVASPEPSVRNLLFYLATQQERSNPELFGDSGRMRGVDVSCTGFQCLLLQQN